MGLFEDMWSNVRTVRDTKHKYRVIVKGAIPEPKYPAVTWPILGSSSLRFSKLKEGYCKNVQLYWMNQTNMQFDSENDEITQLTGTSEISPALGPTTTPSLLNSPREEYRSYLQYMTVRVMNQYYREYLLGQLAIVNELSNYTKTTEVTNLILSLGLGKGVNQAYEVINVNRQKEEVTPLKDPVYLIFEPSKPNPASGGPNKEQKNPGFALLQTINKNILTFRATVILNGWIANTDSAKQAFEETFDMYERRKDELSDALDLNTASQEVFGFPGLDAWRREELTSYIPFDIRWEDVKVKNEKGKEVLQPRRLPLGIPFILRILMDSPPIGSDSKSRVHFDLGDRLRMTIEQGKSISLHRKRSEAEVTKYLKDEFKLMDPSEKSEIEKQYKEISETTTGSGLSSIEKAEMMLEAYRLSLELYNVTTVSTPGDYADAMQGVHDQKAQLAQLKTQQAKIREEYKEKSKKASGGKLSSKDKAERNLKISSINEQISLLRRNVGKNEVLRRKIINIEKVLYSQHGESVELDDTLILDTPLSIKITDYGMGIVLFEFNNGKNFHVFTDKEVINKSSKVKNKLGGKKSGGTGTNKIRILDEDSYNWVISETGKDGKQIGGKLRISGNGGSFTFAYDEVDVQDGVIYVPVAVEPKMKIIKSPITLPDAAFNFFASLIDGYQESDLDSLSPQIQIDQEKEIVMVTNLPAYSDKRGTKPDVVDEEIGEVSWSEGKRGGKIKIDIMSGADESKMPAVEDIPGFTQWVQFLTSTDSSSNKEDVYITNNVKAQYIFFRIRIQFKANRDENGKAIGLPILFRAYLNILAEPRPWAELDTSVHTITGSGVGSEENPSEYTLKVSPSFNEGKRRPMYQVSVTYKAGVPDNLQHRLPDYLVGKRCDIEYEYPVESGNWIRVCTDGIIDQQESDDMLAITQHQAADSLLKTGGFYQYRLTRTTFNVMSTVKFLEDKLVTEGLVLEGYSLKEGLSTLLQNSGIEKSKLTFLGNGEQVSTGKYPKAKQTEEKYLPVALPGSTHSFIMGVDKNRYTAVEGLLEQIGWTPVGTQELWVNRFGQFQLSGPISLGRDPRFDNSLMFYNTRGKVGATTTQKESCYIYQAPIKRKRVLDDFYTVIKVAGAVDQITGKHKTIGVVKAEAVSDKYKDENIYYGHHKHLETISAYDAKTEQQLQELLYFNYNIKTFPRDVWEVTVPYNPFVMPCDVVFIVPDTGGSAPMFPKGEYSDSGGLSDLNSISWKIVDVSGELEEDTMTLVVAPLNKEEKKYLSTLLKDA